MSGGDVIRQFFGAMASGDMEAAKALVHEDFVMDRPEVEGDPRFVGSGDVWVAQMRLRYASGLSYYVAVLELRGGKLARGTGYFASPFPAQEYRARFAEKA